MASKGDEVRLLLSSGEEGGGSESEEEEKTSKLSFSARAPWPPLVWGFLSVGLVALGLLEIGCSVSAGSLADLASEEMTPGELCRDWLLLHGLHRFHCSHGLHRFHCLCHFGGMEGIELEV